MLAVQGSLARHQNPLLALLPLTLPFALAPGMGLNAFFAFTLKSVDPWVMLPVALVIFFGVGLLVYALVMRGVIHASHNVQIFTTVGLSTALQNIALVLWSGDYQLFRPWHASVVLRLGSTAFNLSQVIAFAVAIST